MPDYDINCSRCGLPLTHVCNQSIEDAYKLLINMQLENTNVEDAPFFSETFLYETFGKDDARTIMGVIANLLKSCGIEDYSLCWPSDKGPKK